MAFEIDKAYRLMNVNSYRAVSPVANSTSDSAILAQYGWRGDQIQKWLLYPLDYGYYAFINTASGRVMNVQGYSKGLSAKVEQYKWSGNNANQWYLQSQPNNSYNIENRNSGLVLNVQGYSTSDGGLLEQYTPNGNIAEEWYIEDQGVYKTLPSIPTQPLPPVPVYHDYTDQLPAQTDPVVVAYTIAPAFAISDSQYGNDVTKQFSESPYYLYVKEQYWKLVQSHTFAPGEAYSYSIKTGMTDTDQTTSETTTSTTVGADAGLQFKNFSTGLSTQYSTELKTTISNTTEKMTETTQTFSIVNTEKFTVAWSKYILVTRYHVQRFNGTTVGSTWSFEDPNRTQSSYYPNATYFGRPLLLERETSRAVN